MAKYVLCSICMLCAGSIANADLIIQFGGSTITGSRSITGPVTPGSSVVVPVLAYDDGANLAGPITIDNATVSVDIGGSFSSPPSIGLDLAPFENFDVTDGSIAGFTSSFTDAVSPILGYDRNVSGTGTSFSVSTDPFNPTVLFNLTFDVESGTLPGTYFVGENGANFVGENGANFPSSFSLASVPIPQGISFVGGGVSVVPEPSSLVLLGLVGTLAAVQRVFRSLGMDR